MGCWFIATLAPLESKSLLYPGLYRHQTSTYNQASHFDWCDHVPACYHVAKFCHEHEKFHWQFGKYFFNISAVSYVVIEVLLVDNNLFKVRKFPIRKNIFSTVTYLITLSELSLISFKRWWWWIVLWYGLPIKGI